MSITSLTFFFFKCFSELHLGHRQPTQPALQQAAHSASTSSGLCSIVATGSITTSFNYLFLSKLVPEDFQVHIYHSKKDRVWVKRWISGMMEANRFNVTTNKQPSENGSRIILVLTPELFNEPFTSAILGSIQGKNVLGIKLRDCEIPEEIEKECTSYMDLTTTDLSDLTFHITFMFRVRKSLKLPISICSA